MEVPSALWDCHEVTPVSMLTGKFLILVDKSIYSLHNTHVLMSNKHIIIVAYMIDDVDRSHSN